MQTVVDTSYIRRLIDGDYSAMNDIYRSFRSGFVSFAHSALGLGRDDAADLFQDAVICLLNNIRNGKVTNLDDARVKSYLYTVGRYIHSNRRRKRTILCSPLVWDDGSDTLNLIENIPEDAAENPDEKETRLQVVMDVVGSIPEPCSKLLDMQYFRRKKQAEIAAEMGYKSADSVKTMVDRCKGKVRVIIKQRYKELGYE